LSICCEVVGSLSQPPARAERARSITIDFVCFIILESDSNRFSASPFFAVLCLQPVACHAGIYSNRRWESASGGHPAKDSQPPLPQQKSVPNRGARRSRMTSPVIFRETFQATLCALQSACRNGGRRAGCKARPRFTPNRRCPVETAIMHHATS